MTSLYQELQDLLDKHKTDVFKYKKADMAQFHPAETNMCGVSADPNIDPNSTKMWEKADNIEDKYPNPFIPKETVELNIWPREMELASEAFQLFTQIFNSTIFPPDIQYNILYALKRKISEELEKVIKWTQKAEE